jgi:uncharacterized integral membrane protein
MRCWARAPPAAERVYQNYSLEEGDGMRSIIRIIVFVPLGLLLLFFAMANRGLVKVGFDPFAAGDPNAPSFEAPLFLVVLVSAAVGVTAGSLSSWLAHRRHRRDAREARKDAKKARAEVDELRARGLASLSDESAGESAPLLERDARR